ncbi:hypothetical protein BC826DRAFT_993439, partial [Russula brevipes]
SEPPPRQRRKPGRVPVSCAECRRLKLKCDRKVPCERCSKRGCAAICPDGILAKRRTNVASGLITANAELRAAEMERMTRRIRVLEQGLEEVYATISDEVHPLLQDEATAVASGPSTPPVFATPSPRHDDPSVYRDTIGSYFGTLNIGPKGSSYFYGATARGEYLLKPYRKKHDTSYFRRTRLSERVLLVPFPEAPPEFVAPEIREIVYGHLPPFEDARGACELFLNYSSYISSSLTREELLHVLEIVYQNKGADPEPTTHYLSLIFIVLALSRLLYGEDNYTVESQDYFVLCRVALSLDSPVTITTVTAVQTIVYMAEYLVLSDVHIDPTGCAKAWTYMGMAMKLAHSIGLREHSATGHYPPFSLTHHFRPRRREIPVRPT